MFQPYRGAVPCRPGRRPVAPTSRIPRHIDGNRLRKKTATKPPRHAAVKVESGSIGSPSFRITIFLENKVPKSGVLVAGAEEASVAGRGKVQEVRGGLYPHREPNERKGPAGAAGNCRGLGGACARFGKKGQGSWHVSGSIRCRRDAFRRCLISMRVREA
jgi:hypothetical protein